MMNNPMMNTVSAAFAACCLAVLVLAPLATAEEPSAPTVSGDYVDVRDCDVWTGPCFSNGEINVAGTNGIIGWVVREGTWQGVRLDALAIVAVVDTEGTLTTDSEGKAQTALLVDERASDEQAKALIALARKLAPRYLKTVLKTRRAPITYKRKGMRVTLEAGKGVEAKIGTRALDPVRDEHCGNEAQTYPSLSEGTKAKCAKTVESFYRGKDLGGKWRHPDARSALVGTFSL